MNIIERAKDLAFKAHGSINQKRKFTDEPYINHPRRVASLVGTIGGTPNMICAAWLHDVIEDVFPINNEFNIESIASATNDDVARLVIELTDVSKPQDGNRAARKAIDRQRLSVATNDAKTIKLADLIDNTCDIVVHDKKFAEVYLEEKKLLLPCLIKGNAYLYRFCEYLLNKNLGHCG